MTTRADVIPFSRKLTDASGSRVAQIIKCDWVQGVASDTLPEEAFLNWAGQCAWFCRLEGAALHHLLSLDPPERLAGLFERLLADTVREPRQLEEMIIARGGRVPERPWPVCKGYGRDVQGFARAGLVEGTAAVFGVEWFYWAVWSAVKPDVPENSPYRPWVNNWTDPGFGDVVTGLGECLDDRMGWRGGLSLTPETCEQAEVAFAGMGEWELAFWNMCTSRQDWASMGVQA